LVDTVEKGGTPVGDKMEPLEDETPRGEVGIMEAVGEAASAV
jgi:hypothetical protein